MRLSLWVTAAWAGHLSVVAALDHALPDIDDIAGDVDRFDLWPTLGERVLVCALPRSGDLTTVPAGNPVLSAAAAQSGECVYVPTLGGALVPEVEAYGSQDDIGWQLRLTAFECDPTPIHRFEALDESQIERRLREQLIESTAVLEDLDIRPFAGSTMRAAADARLSDVWGVPPGLPGRAIRTIQLAATVGNAVDLALEHSHALSAADHGARDVQLHRLQSAADRALAEASNVCALSLAGLRIAH